MQERPQNYNAEGDESEATLIAPRFDANDARRAHPVVPLEEARTPASFMNTRVPLRRSLKRSWAITLMVIALIAVGAIGGAVATKFLRRPQATPTAQAPADVAPTQESAPAQSAPAQTSEVPIQSDASAAASPAAASPVAPQAPREDARVKRPSQPSRGARGQVPRDDADIIAPAELVRGDRGESRDEGEGRRGHWKERGRDRRDGRDDNGDGRDGDGEKEMRKTSKRAKGKVPRLVDVLTNP